MDNKSEKYNYSIVIPHYNIPELLDRCLQSIPVRPDVQVIVADDVSNDESLAKLRVLEEKYTNACFIYSKTKGYGGRGRNLGIEQSLGRYVIFADADDYFSDKLCEILDDYRQAEADIVFFKSLMVDSDTGSVCSQQHHGNTYIDLWNEHPQKSELYLRFMFGEPWCKMIKRRVIVDNHIRFDEIRMHDDTTFSYLVGYHSKNITIDNRILYNYVIRPGSISRYRDKSVLPIKIDVFGRSELFFRNHDIPIHEDRQYQALCWYIKYFSFSGFKNGFKQLERLGFKKSTIRKDYSKAMGVCSFFVPLWNVIFAPDFFIKVYCFYEWVIVTIPRCFKYNVLKKENVELRRY